MSARGNHQALAVRLARYNSGLVAVASTFALIHDFMYRYTKGKNRPNYIRIWIVIIVFIILAELGGTSWSEHARPATLTSTNVIQTENRTTGKP
jgi:hypothetical protein